MCIKWQYIANAIERKERIRKRATNGADVKLCAVHVHLYITTGYHLTPGTRIELLTQFTHRLLPFPVLFAFCRLKLCESFFKI